MRSLCARSRSAAAIMRSKAATSKQHGAGEGPRRKVVLAEDEYPRPETTLERSRKLEPSFLGMALTG